MTRTHPWRFERFSTTTTSFTTTTKATVKAAALSEVDRIWAELGDNVTWINDMPVITSFPVR